MKLHRLLSLVLLQCACIVFGAAAAPNYVLNGSFEQGIDLSLSGGSVPLDAVDSTSVAGWVIESGSIDYIGTRWVAGEGARCLDLSGEDAGSIRQVISELVPGQTYRLTFLLAGNPEVGPVLKQVRVSIGSVESDFLFNTPGGPGNLGWSTRSLYFIATNTTATLRFTSLTRGWSGPAVDGVSLESFTPTSPVIIQQPQAQTRDAGGTADLNVLASGESLRYQWEFNNAVLAGATQASLSLPNVQVSQAGGYRVIVENDFGAVTSVVATLTVVPAPPPPPPPGTYDLEREFTIASNPHGVWSYGAKTTVGGAMTLNSASGSFPEGHEGWMFGGGLWPMVFHNKSAHNITSDGGNGVYPPGSVWYAAGENGATRNFGVIRFTAPGSGLFRVATAVQCALTGGSAQDADFHVVQNGVELLGQNLPKLGSTSFSNELVLVSGETVDFLVGRGPDGNQYGSILKIQAQIVQLTTNPPSITSQPSNQSVTAGDTATFSVTAAGTPPLTYQWRYNDADVSGATQSSLTLANVQFAQAGGYSVVVANSVGSITSSVATLTVTPPPVPVRLATVNAVAGGQAQVPVELVATGNENALAFSLNFTTSSLQFLGADPGADLPAGSGLLVNTDMASSGKVGLAVALAPGTSLSAGTRQVIVARFAVASVTTPVTIPISFGDQPTTRQLADSQAQVLPATFQPGAVVVAASLVQVVGTTTASGGEATVRVQLVAQGNENAAGFSLNFNGAVLGFIDAVAGSGVPPSAAFIANGAGTGRLGLALALPAGTAFPAGTQEVAVIRFSVATVVAGMTIPITFGDQPTARQLSDGFANPLPVNFAGSTVVITEVQFEGDVAPRPAGDGGLTIIDLVQMGRLVAALDTIGSPAEFQRVDCAPRASRGNGAVTVSDLVQVGRYTVGLDPLTPVGGPDAEAGGGAGGGFLPASAPVLSVMNTSIPQGQTNNVPIMLEASGEENALSFSLSYDATKLAFHAVLNGSGAPSAGLTINSNQMASGRIGVVVALSPGQKISAGTRELVRVRFAATNVGASTSSLSFGNQPVGRETSDVTAGTLPTTYTDGVVSVTVPVGPPLQMNRDGSLLYLRWSTTPPGFVLESANAVSGATWTAVPGVVDLGDQKLAVVSMTGPQKYFRLKKP